MSNAITPVTVQSSAFGDLRGIHEEEGDVLVAKDVAQALGYRSANDLTRRLDSDEVSTRLVRTSQVNRRVKVITEAGFYKAVFGSKVPLAKQYQRWVTHEVLPTIRKNGAYVSPSITAEQVEQLQAELALLRKKALYAEMLEVSGDTCTIKELAALLTQAGFKVGQNKLFELLRNEGYLIKPKRRDKNTPTQKAIEMGLFVVEQRANIYPDARAHVYRQTLVTSKGQIFFLDRFAPQRLLLATA